jgi:pimeloyl-ACP methyl ester carboxylesterase
MRTFMHRISRRRLLNTAATAAALVTLGSSTAASPTATRRKMSSTQYRNVLVDGLNIFYREAGPRGAPVLLMLHGFPSSSRMWEPLLSRLSDRYHLIAPDYPGFGHSDAPAPAHFSYTFDHLAAVMNRFCDALSLKRYTLAMQDYGGPVGLRMALSHPERITAMIVQNAVSHEQGLSPLWVTRRAYWADRAANESKLRQAFTSLEAARQRHVGSSPHPESYDPDLWCDEFAFLSQPGQDQIQSDLFYDYRTNVAAYPLWQQWLREHEPPLLVVWGTYDATFTVEGATAYRADVPKAQVHLLSAGHFALDEAPDEIANLTRNFLQSLSA